MRDLTQLRRELDQLDRELASLALRRMAVAEEVAAYKQAHSLPILDAAREAEVLRSRAALGGNPVEEEELKQLFTLLMRLSRQRQAAVMERAGERHA